MPLYGVISLKEKNVEIFNKYPVTFHPVESGTKTLWLSREYWDYVGCSYLVMHLSYYHNKTERIRRQRNYNNIDIIFIYSIIITSLYITLECDIGYIKR